MNIEEARKFEPVFGSWKIVKLLGQGSFGSVFEIERSEFGNTYKSALKIISVPQSENDITSCRLEGMDENSTKEYFRNVVTDVFSEFDLMSKLKGNSNIVSCEDIKVIEHKDKIGWDILIRMELLTPFDVYFADRKPGRDELLKLGTDMCRALELCSKYNIVHRDIKPSNIFVSDLGEFKLGDFGVARTMDRNLNASSKKGTYEYMAPEVYNGKKYDSTVDIYSVGIVLYRYFNNNRLPFYPQPPQPITYNSKESAFIKRISGETLPPPAEADINLTAIIRKACSSDPKNRYSTPAEFRTALESVSRKSVNMDVNAAKVPAFAEKTVLFSETQIDDGKIPSAEQADVPAETVNDVKYMELTTPDTDNFTVPVRPEAVVPSVISETVSQNFDNKIIEKTKTEVSVRPVPEKKMSSPNVVSSSVHTEKSAAKGIKDKKNASVDNGSDSGKKFRNKAKKSSAQVAENLPDMSNSQAVSASASSSSESKKGVPQWLKDNLFMIFAFVPVLNFIPFFFMNARVENRKYKLMGWLTVIVYLLFIFGAQTVPDIASPYDDEYERLYNSQPSPSDYISYDEFEEKYVSTGKYANRTDTPEYKQYEKDYEAFWKIPENFELKNNYLEWHTQCRIIGERIFISIFVFAILICILIWTERAKYIRRLNAQRNTNSVVAALSSAGQVRNVDILPAGSDKQVKEAVNAPVVAQNVSAVAPVDINAADEETLASLKGLTIIDAKKAISVRERIGGFKTKDQFYEAINAKPHIIAGIDDIIYVGTVEEKKPDSPQRKRAFDI